MTKWGILFALLFSAYVYGDQCHYRQEINGKLVANKFYTISLGCLVQVTPLDKPDLRYREYYFDERGRFLDFHSAPGDYRTSTSTDSVFLFPNGTEPDFKFLEDGSVEVLLASGDKVIVSQDLKLNRSLDTGMRLLAGSQVGGYKYHNPKATSEFVDASGMRCTVLNSEIFDYRSLYGEPVFFYDTAPRLRGFLGERCPQLRY